MSTRNIRLWNKQKFDIGIFLADNPVGVNITAGTFKLVSEDDLYYVAATCDFLQRGLLTVEEKNAPVLEEVGVVPAAVTDEEITKILGTSAKKIGEWLTDIEDPIVLDRVYDIAKEMDLSAAKLKVLSAKMPDREFI